MKVSKLKSLKPNFSKKKLGPSTTLKTTLKINHHFKHLDDHNKTIKFSIQAFNSNKPKLVVAKDPKIIISTKLQTLMN